MSTREQWAGDLGRKWARMADAQDALLGVFQQPAIAALGPLEGRRILDLGCGQGTSSFALAAAGADEVVGLDISPDLLAVAAARKKAGVPGAERVRFALSDAAEATFDDPFDGLLSRFGAMFFDEPVAAWANLRAAMKPGAPLAVAPVEQRRVPFEVWMSDGFMADHHVTRQGILRSESFPHDFPFHSVMGAFGMTSPIYKPQYDIFRMQG